MSAKQERIVKVETPKWNTSAVQIYYHPIYAHERTVRYQGKCILCGRRTYGHDDGQDDPRGILGDHASMPFVAEDYDCTGPDVPCCFLCQNNTEEQYNAALRFAKKRWQCPKEA